MDKQSLVSKYAFLGSNALFCELSQSDLNDLIAITTNKTYMAQQVVLRQGEPGDEMFIIVSGKVNVRLQLADDEEITIGELMAGEAFGEIALFDRQPRTATVVTGDTCEFLILHREAFHAFIIDHPPVAIQLLTIMSERLRRTNDLLKDSMYSEVTARLADALRNIANAYGKNTRKGLQIDTVFNDNELGEIAGVPGEVVTAQLRHWRKEGVINLSHGYLTLIKPEALSRTN